MSEIDQKPAMHMPGTYVPADYESNIYALWERSEVFTPKNRGGKGYFSQVMPPPNANGNLHIGYALTGAVEDILARYHRMQGRATLLVPGADHAGFETWVVYEKHLAAKGKSRFDYTRDELYAQVWDFVQQNKNNFEKQMRAMGFSCDWSRFTFTLDNKVVLTAYETFKKMWHDKLLYRGERLVNYCTFHGTAFADIEVEHKEVMGHLWHIKYPLSDDSGEIVVATTRPETMLGDVAVAVHPNDERYKGMIGKSIKLPLTGKEVPVVADEFVAAEFGTGAVKVTPAHDPNDYEVAERHDLTSVTVIGFDGKLNENTPEAFRGKTIEEGRQAVVDALKEQGLLVKEEDYTHSVGHCYKCGTVLEPLLREQWFVSMQPLAKRAIKSLQDNDTVFHPAAKKEQLISYLENLRDWNISRQIAWGIPIPAFQNIEDPDDWIFDTQVGQEQIEVKGKTYRRDPDVLDTWFSSGSWPYVTLNYPGGDDYKDFYPLSLMETGGEILYPWVSRMLMMGLYMTDRAPFSSVYIHGYVMAEDGAKMSKSLGNVIDPMEAIAQHGSDALRMGIIAGRSAAVNRGYDPRKVEDARNFCNKLWNVARFIETKCGGDLPKTSEPESAADHWILHKLQHTTDELSRLLESYRLAEAYEALYHFVWDDLADWYIEASKAQLNTGILATVLENTLRLAHPFAPFVTETIWQTLGWHKDSVLAIEQWREAPKFNEEHAQEFASIIGIVSEARQMISQLQVSRPMLYYTDVPFLAANAQLLTQLARLGGVSEVKAGHGLHLIKTRYTCWLDVDQQTAQHYLQKLRDEQADQEIRIKKLEERLSNKQYTDRAPRNVVQQTEQELSDARALAQTTTGQIQSFIDAASVL